MFLVCTESICKELAVFPHSLYIHNVRRSTSEETNGSSLKMTPASLPNLPFCDCWFDWNIPSSFLVFITITKMGFIYKYMSILFSFYFICLNQWIIIQLFNVFRIKCIIIHVVFLFIKIYLVLKSGKNLYLYFSIWYFRPFTF